MTKATLSAERGGAFLDALHAETLKKRAASRGRLPAYGKALMQLRTQGLVPQPPQLHVILDDWSLREGCPGRVVVGYDQDPALLRYDFIAGLDVIVGYSSWRSFSERRDALISALVRCNPRRLITIDVEGRDPSMIVISERMGLEIAKYGELECAA